MACKTVRFHYCQTVPIIKMMARTPYWLAAGALALAIAAAGCMSPQSQAQADPASIGSEEPAAYTPPSTTHPAPLKDGKVDQTQSQALTEYLKAHHLPLVGAQVVNGVGGQKQIILFGYVRTDYGRGDAESKARRYVAGSNVTVDNRIKIEPSLADLNPPAAPNQQASNALNQPFDPNDPDAGSDLEEYQAQRYQDQMQAQQMYSGGYGGGYSSGGPSGLSMLVPLLGGIFGGSIGGGGFGVRSYGYPSAPPPSYPPGYYSTPPPYYP
jgi:hypothetical protein